MDEFIVPILIILIFITIYKLTDYAYDISRSEVEFYFTASGE